MNPLGLLHTGAAVLALATGTVVLLQRKGTRLHRRIGWAYVASMATMNGTALLIYRLFGGFGPFHVAALVSLATLAVGIATVVRRRPAHTRVEHHYWWMAYSYLGLVAAGVAETTTRSGVVGFWWAVLAATVFTFGVGATMIRRRAAATLAPFVRAAPPTS